MAVGIGLDGDAGVESGGVVFQVRAQEIGVDGVGDVGGDHEAVGVHLGEAVCTAAAALGKGFADPLKSAGEKVAVGALAEERANFFIVKAADYFDGTGICLFSARGNQCLDSGEGAEFIVDATCKDEFLVQPAKLSWLSVEQLELPIDDATICLMLATEFV